MILKKKYYTQKDEGLMVLHLDMGELYERFEEVFDEHPQLHNEEITLPFRYVVCDNCGGTGKIVNPNIDGHGITYEEFEEDPDFERDYFNGVYDICCNVCNGSRVLPEIIESNLSDVQKLIFEAIIEADKFDYRYERQCRYERQFGY
jgi:hypothetical protein